MKFRKLIFWWEQIHGSILLKQSESRKKGGQVLCFEDAPCMNTEHMPRMVTTPGYTSYLKIAEGCSNGCTFCYIPYVKGPYAEPEHSFRGKRSRAAGGQRSERTECNCPGQQLLRKRPQGWHNPGRTSFPSGQD
mgnify:CR=1 FL=1